MANWIQGAINPAHRGYCTPMSKKTCTPRRKALARTLKKMARRRGAGHGMHKNAKHVGRHS
jgi:hypothetical protein